MSFTVSKPTAMWLLIFAVVAIALAGIQIVRVNKPRAVEKPGEQRIYTAKGPLLTSQVEVGAFSFYSHKIDLNRRMRLSGSFRTANLKSTVSVLVLREADFESWKNGGEVTPVVRTNLVPGGKLSPVLEPNVYYLVIDNRSNDRSHVVSADFSIE